MILEHMTLECCLSWNNTYTDMIQHECYLYFDAADVFGLLNSHKFLNTILRYYFNAEL